MMTYVDWIPILSTIAGAVVALSGTLLADVRRGRDQQSRDTEQLRWQNCVDFTLALDSAHGLLREVARTQCETADRQHAADRAAGDAGLYNAREKLLVSGTPKLVTAGETAFLHLIEIRNAVREGATLKSAAYHHAYHNFAEKLWDFRMTIRASFGHQSLSPESLNRASWSEREQCVECNRSS
jgi:hypothetical protein